MDKDANKPALALAWAQGCYFLLTGIWPLVSVETFERVTGEKTDHLIADDPAEADHWMLNTIAALIISIAVVILSGARRGKISHDVVLLSMVSALALAIIDVVYVCRGTIAPIYLADATVEIAFIGGWCWVLAHHKPAADC